MTIKEIKMQLALGTLSTYDKVRLANDIGTSEEILSMLSTDKICTIRDGVAENPNTPIKVLKKLSTDEDWYVRRWVADNPSTPIDILKELSTDKDGSVRWWAAQKFKVKKEGG